MSIGSIITGLWLGTIIHFTLDEIITFVKSNKKSVILF